MIIKFGIKRIFSNKAFIFSISCAIGILLYVLSVVIEFYSIGLFSYSPLFESGQHSYWVTPPGDNQHLLDQQDLFFTPQQLNDFKREFQHDATIIPIQLQRVDIEVPENLGTHTLDSMQERILEYLKLLTPNSYHYYNRQNFISTLFAIPQEYFPFFSVTYDAFEGTRNVDNYVLIDQNTQKTYSIQPTKDAYVELNGSHSVNISGIHNAPFEAYDVPITITNLKTGSSILQNNNASHLVINELRPIDTIKERVKSIVPEAQVFSSQEIDQVLRDASLRSYWLIIFALIVFILTMSIFAILLLTITIIFNDEKEEIQKIKTLGGSDLHILFSFGVRVLSIVILSIGWMIVLLYPLESFISSFNLGEFLSVSLPSYLLAVGIVLCTVPVVGLLLLRSIRQIKPGLVYS